MLPGLIYEERLLPAVIAIIRHFIGGSEEGGLNPLKPPPPPPGSASEILLFVCFLGLDWSIIILPNILCKNYRENSTNHKTRRVINHDHAT